MKFKKQQCCCQKCVRQNNVLSFLVPNETQHDQCVLLGAPLLKLSICFKMTDATHFVHLSTCHHQVTHKKLGSESDHQTELISAIQTLQVHIGAM